MEILHLKVNIFVEVFKRVVLSVKAFDIKEEVEVFDFLNLAILLLFGELFGNSNKRREHSRCSHFEKFSNKPRLLPFKCKFLWYVEHFSS